MNLFDARFEVKDLTETGVFAGYGSVYGNLDEGGDIVSPGAFGDSLTEWAAKGRMPALLWQHRSGEPIGAYTKMHEEAGGLHVEGKLALKTQRGIEAYELLKMKAISGLSVGFQTREDSLDQKTGVRTIKKGDLWEVSLVTFPMNDKARIASVKSFEELIDIKSAEHFLREAGGFSRTEATAFIARMKSILQGEPDDSEFMKKAAAVALGGAAFRLFSTR